MASISKRGDYQWQALIRRKGFPTQVKTFTTQTEAEQWARDVEGKMDRKVFIDRSEMEATTLSKIIDRYEVEITEGKAGRVQERSKLKTLRKSFLGSMTLANISPSDITTYRDLRLSKVGPATVNKEMNLISNIFNIAASEFHIKGLGNPVEGVRRPKAPRNRERRLLRDGDELRRILEATESPVLKWILPIAVETAMRRGEMTSIRWADVNLEKQTIHLRDTKNGDDRVVPLSKKAVDTFKLIPHREDGEVFGVCPSSVTTAFIRAVKRAREGYEKECEKLGVVADRFILRNLRLHDMRHEATSRLFEDKNLEMMEVASITGHRDPRQLKRYTHLHAERLAKKLG